MVTFESAVKFFDESRYFERRGDRYIYRASRFAAGFEISQSEKDALFTGLKKLEIKALIKGLGVFCLLAIALTVQIFGDISAHRWAAAVPIIILVIAAADVSYLVRRRDLLIKRILPGREADIIR